MVKLKVFLYALIIVPAVVTFNLPYEGSDSYRIYSIPPFFLIGLLLIGWYAYNSKINKSIISINYPFLWFVIYINISTLIINPSGLIYSLSWLINYLIYRFFSVRNTTLSLHRMDFNVILITLIIIGLFRLFTGLDTDGNPYALVNRNATSTIIVFLFVYYKSYFTRFVYTDALFILLLLLIGSRSSIIAIGTYYMLMAIRSLSLTKMFRFVFFIVIALYMASYNDTAVKRFKDGTYFFQQLGKKQVEKVGDYERVLLIRAGITVFRENFLFGVGEGNKMYQSEFNRLVDGYDRDSRAHNFFVSRLANFGIVGFALFLYGYFMELKEKKDFYIFSVTIAVVFLFNEYVLLPHIFAISGLIPNNDSSWKSSRIVS